MPNDLPKLQALSVFLGEWDMRPEFPGLPPIEKGATVTFEWMSGERFLIQRWSVPIPEAPDGVAIIGADPERAGGYLQHYFDSRGIARVYRMSLEGKVWRLWRDTEDFSPLEFNQRFEGRFSDDGRTITGTFEIQHPGQPWQKDFDGTYQRVR
jgi:hypothetical protein